MDCSEKVVFNNQINQSKFDQIRHDQTCHPSHRRPYSLPVVSAQGILRGKLRFKKKIHNISIAIYDVFMMVLFKDRGQIFLDTEGHPLHILSLWTGHCRCSPFHFTKHFSPSLAKNCLRLDIYEKSIVQRDKGRLQKTAFSLIKSRLAP